MKKLFSYILLTIILLIAPISFANAVDCIPKFDGDYIIEGNCTWPSGGIKVFGNIVATNKIVTVPTGRVMGIDLSTKAIYFTTGKVLFSGTAKADNSVSNRYYTTHAYTASSGITNCPVGYQVVNNANGTPTAYQGGTQTIGLATSGSFHCGK